MIGVVCEGLPPQSPIAKWAQSLQNRFQLKARPCTPQDIRLQYTADYTEAPWRLHPAQNLVVVSSWRCSEMARYAGRTTRDYLLLTGMLALTQFRTLALNPHLTPVDFIYRCDESCLFVHEPGRALERFLLATDHLRICCGCANFYHCLGVDSEWVALNSVLDAFRQRRTLAKTN